MTSDQVIVVAGAVGILLLVAWVVLNSKGRLKLGSSELQEDESPFAELMARRAPRSDAPAAASHPPPRPLRLPSEEFHAGWGAPSEAEDEPAPPAGVTLASVEGRSNIGGPAFGTRSREAQRGLGPSLAVGVSLPPSADPTQLAHQIAAELRAGQKLQAIKRLREHTGWGLAKAKAAVEDYATSGHLDLPESRPSQRPVAAVQAPPAVPDSAQLATLVRRLLGSHGKIAAIKELREVTGWSLKECKDFVERD